MPCSKSAEQRLNAAVLALVYLGQRKEQCFVAHREIARNQNMPTSDVVSLMENLAAAGLVRTSVERQGGVSISKPLGQISLKELYEVCNVGR